MFEIGIWMETVSDTSDLQKSQIPFHRCSTIADLGFKNHSAIHLKFSLYPYTRFTDVAGDR